MMIRILIPLVLIAAAALVARRMAGRVQVSAITIQLQSRWMPLVLGIATAVVIWWVWGSLSQVAIYHDEAAYELQARIFATGRWTMPARPLPEFFVQMAVLLAPVMAPKMPPGHAIMMIPGIWVGLPGLVSVVLGGLAGALTFALVRRLSGPWIALLTWAILITAPRGLLWRASYFSEATTGVLWLVSWWALVEWRDNKRLRWLLLLATCIGWGAITRPLTMLAFALPVAAVVLRTVARHRMWRDLALALALGTGILGIIPLWSSRTTGDIRTTPLGLYTRTYMPWDIPGLGLDSTPPLRSLPPDLARVDSYLAALHSKHTLRALPQIVERRATFIARDMWGGWRWPLAIVALVGLVVMPMEGVFAVVTAVLLVMSYAWYAHAPSWTIYYMEAQPVLAFATALGVWAFIKRLVMLPLRASDGMPRVVNADAAIPLGVALVLLLALYPTFSDVQDVRRWRKHDTSYHRLFRDLVAAIPASKSIVFVRYRPDHIGHFSLVRNVPDLESARAWVVYDRGAENARLMHLAPDRVPYLYDDSRLAIVPLGDTAGLPSVTRNR